MRGPIRGKEIVVQLEARLAEVVPSHTFRIKRKGGDIDVEYITKKGHHEAHMFASEGVNGVLRLLRIIRQQYEADRDAAITHDRPLDGREHYGDGVLDDGSR